MRKFLAMLVLATLGLMTGCDIFTTTPAQQPESASGVKKATVQVQTNANGLTIEQQNIADRLREDNKPGAIKHLYVISPYSGQVIIYSTVRGKVTSDGKRLTPVTINGGYSSNGWYGGFPVQIGGREVYTNEVLQDDGTYGHSGDYLYWWDSKGAYHQHYLTGGQILHVSNQPLAVKGIIINMEISRQAEEK